LNNYPSKQRDKHGVTAQHSTGLHLEVRQTDTENILSMLQGTCASNKNQQTKPKIYIDETMQILHIQKKVHLLSTL
jgi:hypothetical protein